jgi:hypothetical protein
MFRHFFARHATRPATRRMSRRPTVEQLEGRCLLATFTVNLATDAPDLFSTMVAAIPSC